MAATIECVRGDITTERVDAIVNAANSSLLGGGGVDGAIHAAAGPALLEECRRLRGTRYPDGLPVGEAVATGAGDLPATWVIHTVGPNRNAGQTDPALLRSCFIRSLAVARDLGARSLAVPAVSAGIYGWSARDVARIATTAVRDGVAADEGPRLVRFVLFSDALLAAFRSALQTPCSTPRGGPDASQRVRTSGRCSQSHPWCIGPPPYRRTTSRLGRPAVDRLPDRRSE